MKVPNRIIINEDSMLLLRKTISRIEAYEREQSYQVKEREEAFKATQFKAKMRSIPLSLIPYLTLYLLLNCDCFPSCKKAAKKGLPIIRNDEQFFKIILKAAHYCARKFTRRNQELNKRYFLTYCKKRYKKISQRESINLDEDFVYMDHVYTH